MSYGLWDTTQLRKLTEDLGKVSGAVVPAVIKVTAASGDELVRTWRSNARATSGTHAAKYPTAVTATAKVSLGSIGVEVGPTDSAGNQGFLGRILEYGGAHSSPHLDGNRAADVVEPKYAEALALAVSGLLAHVGTTEKVAYTTKAGNTIQASPAQVANWTRGSG